MKNSLNSKSISQNQTFCVIIQARLASARFPKKTMKNIKNHPLLYYLLNQARYSKKISKIIVATTELPEDDEIEDFVRSFGIDVFRGNTNDVLDRYYQCAKKFSICNIIRLSADNPLIDPSIIDNCIEKFENGKYDYVSNIINNNSNLWKYSQNGFPHGFSVEVFTFDALKFAWKSSKSPPEREHVTPFITKNPSLFKLGYITNQSDYSKIRLTVDYEKDFQVVKQIIENLSTNDFFQMNDIVDFLTKNSHLMKLNSVDSEVGYYGVINQ